MKLKELVKEIEKNTGIEIDFRSDVYVLNTNGCTPVMNFTKARDIILYAIEELKICPTSVNVGNILSSLQVNTLKNELENLIFLAQEK